MRVFVLKLVFHMLAKDITIGGKSLVLIYSASYWTLRLGVSKWNCNLSLVRDFLGKCLFGLTEKVSLASCWKYSSISLTALNNSSLVVISCRERSFFLAQCWVHEEIQQHHHLHGVWVPGVNNWIYMLYVHQQICNKKRFTYKSERYKASNMIPLHWI